MNDLEVRRAFQQGLTLYHASQFERAAEILDGAMQYAPEHGDLLQLRGLVLYARRDFTGALAAFEQAMTLVPLIVTAQISMADCYRREGHRATAAVILNYLAGRDDLPTTVLSSLSAGLGGIGEYHAALKVCRLAARREPERDEPLFGMAYYMNKLEYPAERVIPLLRRALSFSPGCQLYQLGLATLYVRTERFEEAYALCKQISPEKVSCTGCLALMRMVFEGFEDDQRREACCRQIARISAQLSENPHSCHGPSQPHGEG
jgi:tetratricopeptide (TPR) repeat protein